MSVLGEGTFKLGFGLMRLPRLADGEIDIPQVSLMVDRFLEAGGTYFDTAFAYNGSEAAIKKALVERYPRDKYTLASKLIANGANLDEETLKAEFTTSLERSGAGYFDYYLLHALQRGNYENYEKYHLWDYVKELKAKGLIRHYGFSFHADPELLEEILEKHPDAEFVQLQINYADWENPGVAARKNWEICKKHGKPVVVMEPVKGGILADPVDSVKAVFDAEGSGLSYAGWAIRYVASKENILTVLSGMSSLEQMEDNLASMRGFTGLNAEQAETIEKARAALARIPVIPCTACNYCAKACPQEIGISGTFTAMNYLTLYGDKAAAKHQEAWLVDMHGRKRAAGCVKCGACEQVCPQHIAIREELEKASAALDQDA